MVNMYNLINRLTHIFRKGSQIGRWKECYHQVTKLLDDMMNHTPFASSQVGALGVHELTTISTQS